MTPLRSWWWRLPHVAWLAVLWAVLWGDGSAPVLIAGALVGAVSLVARPHRPPLTHTLHVGAALRFAGAVLVDVVRANVAIVIEVVTPTDRTRPGVVDVTLPNGDPAVVTATSQAVNLAPGTVVVDQPAADVLRIHVLHLHDAASLIAHIERFADLADAALVPHRTRPTP